MGGGADRWVGYWKVKVGYLTVYGHRLSADVAAEIMDQSPLLGLTNLPFLGYSILRRDEESREKFAIRFSASGADDSPQAAFMFVLSF